MSLFFSILLLSISLGKPEFISESCQATIPFEGTQTLSNLIETLNCGKSTLTHLTLTAENSSTDSNLIIRETAMELIRAFISAKVDRLNIEVKFVNYVKFFLHTCT